MIRGVVSRLRVPMRFVVSGDYFGNSSLRRRFRSDVTKARNVDNGFSNKAPDAATFPVILRARTIRG